MRGGPTGPEIEAAIRERKVAIQLDSPVVRQNRTVHLRVQFTDNWFNTPETRNRLKVHWDFGHDGLWETGWEVAHYFPEARDYTITARFLDSKGACIRGPKTSEGYDLRLMVTEPAEINGGERWSVIVALLNGQYHFWVFDSQGKKVVDMAETALAADKGERLSELKGLLTPFPSESNLSLQEKQNIIDKVASIIGHTPNEEIRASYPITVMASPAPVVGERARIEIIQLAIVLFIALLGLLAGAREQLLKLDVGAGLIAVFLLGFSADTIKNLMTRKS